MLQACKALMAPAFFLAACCLGRDITVSRPIAPGVLYTAIRRTEGPWEIRVLRIRRGEKGVDVSMALGTGDIEGVERLADTIARENRPDSRVVATTNGDFFMMAGNPDAGALIGLSIRRGELVMTARNRLAFVLMADGKPRIGVFNTTGTLQMPRGDCPLSFVNRAPKQGGAAIFTPVYGKPIGLPGVVVLCEGLPIRPNGTWHGVVDRRISERDRVQPGEGEIVVSGSGAAEGMIRGLDPGARVVFRLSTPAFAGPVNCATGGGPELLRNGKIIPPATPGTPRHPRTAVGFGDEEIVLVTVDGRQPGWSMGMTTYELARLMKELGCTHALNLDGGGSTTAWVRGEVVNRPSDGRRRRIANSLLIRSTASPTESNRP